MPTFFSKILINKSKDTKGKRCKGNCTLQGYYKIKLHY